jgi:hypothetical protein
MSTGQDPQVAYATTDAFLARIKYLARQACPQASAAHRCEALAAGLSCSSHATLLERLTSKPSRLSMFNLASFRRRLKELGSPAPLASQLADFRLDVSEALIGWMFANDGYIDSRALRVSFSIDDRSWRRRNAAVRADLKRRGLPDSPKPQAFGGYPGSLTWSVTWLKESATSNPTGCTMVSLRLHAPTGGRQRRGDETRFGWGELYPDHGVHLPAGALLSVLSGGWLQRCLLPFKGTRSRTDVREEICRYLDDETMRAAIESLPPLGIEFDTDGFHIFDEDHRFDPESETVLCVDSLILLGDELASGISARAAPMQEMKAAMEWMAERGQDGLRPLKQDNYMDVHDYAHEKAVAAWTAQRMGIAPELYVRAALWEKACHVLRSGGYVRDSEMQTCDGILAAGLRVLPDNTDCERLAEAAIGLDPEVLAGKITKDEWRTHALQSMNGDMWPCCYYLNWPERRARLASEMLDNAEPSRIDAVRAFALEIRQHLAQDSLMEQDWSPGSAAG